MVFAVRISFLLLIFFIGKFQLVYAQLTIEEGNGAAWEQAGAPGHCLSVEQVEHIRNHLQHVIDSMDAVHPPAPNDKSFEKFRWPLQWAAGFSGESFYGISNFVDHNPDMNAVQDYTCGARTYDYNGYNHQGTDIFLWPNPWQMMHQGSIDVVSAAKGVIISKFDGNFDQNCELASTNWNAVYVRHADNTVAWYGHLKKNSLTPKAVGDSVQEGEYLGKVGSSGSSTAPHLHFEVYFNGNQLTDPFNGSCSQPGSLWKNQRPYYDPVLIKAHTSAGKPLYPPCPQLENLREKTAFFAGDTVFLTGYYRDVRTGDTTIVNVYDSVNQLISTPIVTIHNPIGGHYSGAWWIWTIVIPDGYPSGHYKFVNRYKGKTTTSPFTIGLAPPVQQPDTAAKEPTRLAWEILPTGELILSSADLVQQIDMFDMQGRLAMSKIAGSKEVRLNLDGVARGVYIVRIVTDKETIVRKLWTAHLR